MPALLLGPYTIDGNQNAGPSDESEHSGERIAVMPASRRQPTIYAGAAHASNCSFIVRQGARDRQGQTTRGFPPSLEDHRVRFRRPSQGMSRGYLETHGPAADRAMRQSLPLPRPGRCSASMARSWVPEAVTSTPGNKAPDRPGWLARA